MITDDLFQRGSMSTAGVASVSPIIFTQSASSKVKELVTEEENDALKLRVYVTGGGCSGFQYLWDTTDKKPTVENLWIDPIAEMYVIGCTIDYVTELGGSFLKVSNPNATASCGCGESFAV